MADKPTVLLDIHEVMRRVSLSRASIYEKITTGTFPKQVKRGERASAWIESEIEAWIQARIAERDAKNAA